MRGRPGKERARARNYLLQHPHAKNTEVATAVGVGVRTVSFARAELVHEGKIPRTLADRARDPISATPAAPPPETLLTVASEGSPQPATYQPLDAEQLYAIAEGDEDVDDEQVRRAMLRKLRKMAFDPGIHPQLQMYAIQAYDKLKEQARTAILGPGKPLTWEDAKNRLVLMFKATGAALVIAAMEEAFGLLDKETPDGEATDQPPPAPIGVEEAPSPV